jgi:hypothetical protein
VYAIGAGLSEKAVYWARLKPAFSANRVLQAVAAAGFGGDFGARINGPNWQAFYLLRFEKADGVVHFGFLAFAALGLEFSELAERLPHRTVQR